MISSEDGAHCGFGTSQGSNPNYVGAATAAQHLREAFDAAWQELGISPQPLTSAFFGIAGMSSFRKSNDPETLITWLPRAPKGVVQFDHDLRIAHTGGLSGRPGIVLIAGTGSAGYARTADSRSAVVGGWGALLDDVGSGYWLGLEALRTITRAADGRGAPTSLSTALLEHTQAPDLSGLMRWLREHQDDRAEIAKLAPLVFAAAAAGDEESRRIMKRGAEELVEIAAALEHRLFVGKGTELALMGGVSRNPEYFAAVTEIISARGLPLRLIAPEHSPVVGALWLAMAQIRRPPGPDTLRVADTRVPF